MGESCSVESVPFLYPTIHLCFSTSPLRPVGVTQVTRAIHRLRVASRTGYIERARVRERERRGREREGGRQNARDRVQGLGFRV